MFYFSAIARAALKSTVLQHRHKCSCTGSLYMLFETVTTSPDSSIITTFLTALAVTCFFILFQGLQPEDPSGVSPCLAHQQGLCPAASRYPPNIVFTIYGSEWSLSLSHPSARPLPSSEQVSTKYRLYYN
jgi:hypothetical protein